MFLEELDLWIDPVPRQAPESMAVDEWLLESATKPVLRVYQWQGDWGTVGYFGKLDEAKATFPGIQWTRRWTGGGTVDHRNDWAYSLIVPWSSGSPRLGGAESYRVIHSALAAALAAESPEIRLSGGGEATGEAACFKNPVSHDLVDGSGRKLAGAGQRRNRRGLLHQGSVAMPCSAEQSRLRAGRLATALAATWHATEFEPPADHLRDAVAERYGNPEWNERRL